MASKSSGATRTGSSSNPKGIGNNDANTKAMQIKAIRSQLPKRVDISDELLGNEEAYLNGALKDAEVTFIYHNVKRDRDNERRFTYSRAKKLALDREKDGRYKNYEFWIIK